MMSNFNEFYQTESNGKDERLVNFMDRKLPSQGKSVSISTKTDNNATTAASSSSSSVASSANKSDKINDKVTSNSIATATVTVHPSLIASLQELKRELKDWWAAAATSKRTDDDSREEFADFLTEKYMCQKFDLLPPSEPVSKIRKEVCKTIENFAMDGSINFRKLDNLVQQYSGATNGASSVNIVNNQSLQGGNSTTSTSNSVNNLSHSMSAGALQHEQNNGSLFSKTSPPSRSTNTNDNKDTKKEDSKNKLRDQYTSYLKTKGMM